MSRKFNVVKNYYDKGLWSVSRVKNAVTKGWITEDEFDEIVGENTSLQSAEA